MSEEAFPHLLQLLGDASPVVRDELRRALIPLAPRLGELLARHAATSEQRICAVELLRDWRRQRLFESWRQWQVEELTELSRLEDAHVALCAEACGWVHPTELPECLDELAARCPVSSAAERARALFGEGLLSPAQEDYNLPVSSFLREVIARGRGNPISLCTIFILVGARRGLQLWGIGYPGHFLARDAQGGIWDCYGGGRPMAPDLPAELRGELTPAETRALLDAPVSAVQMVQRVLNNLVKCYVARERRAESNLYYFLGKDLAARQRGMPAEIPVREPSFHPGQLVVHREKSYRGVVLDYHLWSGPRTLRPSYRVLVHGSPSVAAAEELELEADPDGALVAHPYMSFFFSRFEDGAYLRHNFTTET